MKETEYDRFDRANKLKKEATAQQKKSLNSYDFSKKKTGKPKPADQTGKRDWIREYQNIENEEEYNYV